MSAYVAPFVRWSPDYSSFPDDHVEHYGRTNRALAVLPPTFDLDDGLRALGCGEGPAAFEAASVRGRRELHLLLL